MKIETSTVRERVSKKFINHVRKLREQMLMSKTELAKAAGLSVLTVDRVERGEECRMSTKRKLIKALGLNLGDKEQVFGK